LLVETSAIDGEIVLYFVKGGPITNEEADWLLREFDLIRGFSKVVTSGFSSMNS
jgi:hypothetical protein